MLHGKVKIQKAAEPPPSSRRVQDVTAFSDKALCVQYYKHSLWVPRKACFKVGEEVWVLRWAIDSAKDWNDR